MRRLVWVLIVTNLLIAYRALAEPALNSGIDLQYVDHNVRPQDDFYRYVKPPQTDAQRFVRRIRHSQCCQLSGRQRRPRFWD